MGEARRRATLRDKIVSAHPYCIYCGGQTRSTTCDHMPPKQIFDFKQRYKGLEFSSCDNCNSRTSNSEQIIALLSRIYPDGSTDRHRREIEKLLNAVANNNPGLLPALLPEETASHMRLKAMGFSLPPPRKLLSLDSPKIKEAFDQFALKLFLALYFEHTNEIVSHHGGVQYILFTNLSAVKGRIPPVLANLLQRPHTIVQGKKNLGEQFSYGYQVEKDAGLGLFFATFRRSFALGGVVTRDASQHEFLLDEKILRPFQASTK